MSSRFSSNLCVLRRTRGYSQKQLAEMLYVSDKTISKWELGNSEPNLEMLQHICTIFDITTDDILHKDFSATDTEKNPIAIAARLHVTSVLACNLIILLGYLLSIAAYLIFSDPVFVYRHGYDGKWIGIGIYASVTVLVSIVLCVLLLTDYYALGRYPSESGRRNWFRCICGSVWTILFTLSATFLGGYNASDIRAHLVQSFANIFLSAWLLLWTISEIYAMLVYRKHSDFVRTRFRISLLQLPCIGLLVALTAIHLNPEDFTPVQWNASLIVCYLCTIGYAVISTTLYLHVKRIPLCADTLHMLLRNAFSLLVVLCFPIAIARQAYGWQLCLASLLLGFQTVYAVSSTKRMHRIFSNQP